MFSRGTRDTDSATSPDPYDTSIEHTCHRDIFQPPDYISLYEKIVFALCNIALSLTFVKRPRKHGIRTHIPITPVGSYTSLECMGNDLQHIVISMNLPSR